MKSYSYSYSYSTSTLFRFSLLSVGCYAFTCNADTTLVIDKMEPLEWLAEVGQHKGVQVENNTSQPISYVPEQGQAFELHWQWTDDSLSTPSLTLCANRQTGLQLSTAGRLTTFSMGDVVHYRIKPYSVGQPQQQLQIRIYDPENWLPGCSGFSDGRNMLFGLDRLTEKQTGGRSSGSSVSLSMSGRFHWVLYSSGFVAGIPLVEWGNRGSINISPPASDEGSADQSKSPDTPFEKPLNEQEKKKGKVGSGDDPDQPDRGQLSKEAERASVNVIVVILQSLLTDESNIQLLAEHLSIAFPEAVPGFLVSFADQIENLTLPGEYGEQTWLDILHWLANHNTQMTSFVTGFLAHNKQEYQTFVEVLHQVEEEIDARDVATTEEVTEEAITADTTATDQDISELDASDDNHWQVLITATQPELEALAQGAMEKYQDHQPEFVTAFAATHGIELPGVYGQQTWVSIFQWLASHPGHILSFVNSPKLGEMMGMLTLSMGQMTRLADSKGIKCNIHLKSHDAPSS